MSKTKIEELTTEIERSINMRSVTLQIKRQLKYSCPQKRLMYEFVLQNGKEYIGQQLPANYRLRTPHACFYNARQLVKRSRKRLRYCEGFAQSPVLGCQLFHHAWALDQNDQVIDPTLSDSGDPNKSNAELYDYCEVVFVLSDLLGSELSWAIRT